MRMTNHSGNTTIKDALRELVVSQLLEKIPQGRGRPNHLYLLFPDEEVGQNTGVGKSSPVGQKTVLNYGGKSPTSKYISKKISNPLRDYDYEEKESF